MVLNMHYMEKDRLAVEERFYQKCAELLGVEHTYTVPFSYKTRWNQRQAGNGRFPGRGLIRMYQTDLIHVVLNNPVVVSRRFTSEQDVLDFLKKAMAA